MIVKTKELKVIETYLYFKQRSKICLRVLGNKKKKCILYNFG